MESINMSVNTTINERGRFQTKLDLQFIHECLMTYILYMSKYVTKIYAYINKYMFLFRLKTIPFIYRCVDGHIHKFKFIFLNNHKLNYHEPQQVGGGPVLFTVCMSAYKRAETPSPLR
jgi:hypothetical protein